MGILTIGAVYRYARPYNPEPVQVDGLPNYFHAVLTSGQKLPLLESGINPIAATKAADGRRTAAILISSSPHKVGAEETPWQDVFDSDNGGIRYFGDNKSRSRDAAAAPGNRALLDALPYFGGRRLASITTADVRNYVASRQAEREVVRSAYPMKGRDACRARSRSSGDPWRACPTVRSTGS